MGDFVVTPSNKLLKRFPENIMNYVSFFNVNITVGVSWQYREVLKLHYASSPFNVVKIVEKRSHASIQSLWLVSDN